MAIEYKLSGHKISNSEIKQRLNTAQVRDLIDWFIESFDDGYRPGEFAVERMWEFREFLGKLVGLQGD